MFRIYVRALEPPLSTHHSADESPTTRNKDGDTAVHVAAKLGNVETKARFLNPRFNTNVIRYVRTTLLYMNTNIMLEIHRSKVCSPLVCGKRTVGCRMADNVTAKED